jgi:hypothetical protein
MLQRFGRAALVLATLAALGLGTGEALGSGGDLGGGPVEGPWVDQHRNYPPVPYGLTQIRNVFGEPCNAAANANVVFFKAADDGIYYRVNFHAKLGGAASSNLDNDIAGHINVTKLYTKMLHGIWGYACRTKRGSSQYSTHAWGIAVDTNSAFETPGTECNTVPGSLGKIWTDHGWKWGIAWLDCMHFQYATGY